MIDLVEGKIYLVRWKDSTEKKRAVFKGSERGFFIFEYIDNREKFVASPTHIEIRDVT